MRVGLNQAHSRMYTVECYDKYGNLKWIDYIDNLTASEGLDDILNQYYKGSSYTAAHYIGLTDGTPTFASGDTMESHPGWTEVTDYTEASRQSLVWGAVSGGSVDNSASKATFSINSDSTTVGGGFVTTDDDKTATAGTLIGGGAFSAGDKSLDSGDSLNVTVTSSASSS